MREWLGPRVVTNLVGKAFTVTNQDWELTIGVDRNDIQDDNLGTYDPLFAELAEAARKNPDQRLRTLIQSGTTENGFDDVPFFGTTHPLDPAGNQVNSFTTSPLTAANYETVRQSMRCFTGENGEPLNVMPNLLVVPPQLEKEARDILNADFISVASGSTQNNTLKGSAELMVLGDLCNEATVWYLMVTNRAMRPFINQTRMASQLTNMTQATDANVFFNKEFFWGVDSRGAAGFGPWWLAARSIA